ncbi:hypothetical protein BDY21DRAFT_334587 [Lineolata rhizophorae]|uniref:Uncharacterized protein n=1 Tax=Lineolata rhizophorae TaxID=578093 RepID=A0A6A6PCN6_9PEZI|nr:hypothetical protein BDY21DRAFT_334587 [Lineolata rhizophorae]
MISWATGPSQPPRWPANTAGERLRPEKLAPQSLWADDDTRWQVVRQNWVPKKLRRVELSTTKLVARYLRAVGLHDLTPAQAAPLPCLVRDLVQLSRMQLAQLVHETNTHMKALELEPPFTERSFASKWVKYPQYVQDDAGHFVDAQKGLQVSICGLFREHKEGQAGANGGSSNGQCRNNNSSDSTISTLSPQAHLVAKICHNLLASPANPCLANYNALVFFFSKTHASNLFDYTVDSILESHIRVNERTCHDILLEYAGRGDVARFAAFLALMRGANGGLFTASRETRISSTSQGRVIPRTVRIPDWMAKKERLVASKVLPEYDEPSEEECEERGGALYGDVDGEASEEREPRRYAFSRLIQRMNGSPMVFHAVVKGALAFLPFDDAVRTCTNMTRGDQLLWGKGELDEAAQRGIDKLPTAFGNKWGLDVGALTLFLRECAKLKRWEDGVTFWEAIKGLWQREETKEGAAGPGSLLTSMKLRLERKKTASGNANAGSPLGRSTVTEYEELKQEYLKAYAAKLLLCQRCGEGNRFEALMVKAAEEGLRREELVNAVKDLRIELEGEGEQTRRVERARGAATSKHAIPPSSGFAVELEHAAAGKTWPHSLTRMHPTYRRGWIWTVDEEEEEVGLAEAEDAAAVKRLQQHRMSMFEALLNRLGNGHSAAESKVSDGESAGEEPERDATSGAGGCGLLAFPDHPLPYRLVVVGKEAGCNGDRTLGRRTGPVKGSIDKVGCWD